MVVLVLCVIAGLATAVSLLCFGYLLGYNMRSLNNRIISLMEQDEEGSAVVDTSPSKVRQRQQVAPLQDDDSGIVRAKTPRQMRADKERREQEELDRITNSGLR